MKHLTLASVLVVALAACGDDDHVPSDLGESRPTWGATIAFEAGVKLGGCAVGDVDPSVPGNEIVAVAIDGRVFVVRHEEGAWRGEAIARVPGEMIQCQVGDADPSREGLEIVACGMAEGTEEDGGPGAIHLVFREHDAWRTEEVFRDEALVHGVCVADVREDHPGSEIVGVGFSQRATVLGRGEGGWKVLGRVDLDHAGKTVVPFGALAAVANTGPSVLAVAWEGEVIEAEGAGLEADLGRRWITHTLGAGAPQARIGTDGTRLLVACDDGTLRLQGDDGTWPVIHREGAKLRGAVLADVDPVAPGVEAVTAGYEKALTLLFAPRVEGGAWEPLTLWRDTQRFHHVAAGELTVEGLGLEIVAVGYSGRVIVASLVPSAR